MSIEYPIGHKRRRADGIPLLINKFKAAVTSHYPKEKADAIIEMGLNQEKLISLSANQLTGEFV